MSIKRMLSIAAAFLLLFSLAPSLGDTLYGTYVSDWQIVRRPTCTEPGERVRMEGRQRVTEQIPATGHQYRQTGVIIREATCQERAREELVCTVCGHKAWQLTGELAPHTWGEWTVAREAVPGTPGLRQRRCAVCGVTEEEPYEVQALPVHAEEPEQDPGSAEGIDIEPEALPDELPAIILTAQLTEEKTYHLGEAFQVELTLFNATHGVMTLDSSNVMTEEGWPAELQPQETVVLHYGYDLDCSDANDAYMNGGVMTQNIWVRYEDEFSRLALDDADFSLSIAEGDDLRDLALSVLIPGGSQEPYHENDVITFHAEASNIGTVSLDGVIMYDAYGMPATDLSIPAGEYHAEDFQYTVTADDVFNGMVALSFDAVGWDFETNTEIWSNTVDIGLLTVDENGDPAASLTLSAQSDYTGPVVAGSVIPVTLTARNEGKLKVWISDFEAYPPTRNYLDDYSQFEAVLDEEAVPVGAESGCVVKVIVSDDDIAAGTLRRDFRLQYETNEGIQPFYTNNAPFELALSAPVEDKAELTLTCNSHSAETVFHPGDTVWGELTLKNTGKLPVKIINIGILDHPGMKTDPMSKEDLDEWLPLIGQVLQPDDEHTAMYRSSVLSGDLEAKEISRALYIIGATDYTVSDDTAVLSNTAGFLLQLAPEEHGDPVTIVKTRVGDPKHPAGYQAEETVTFSITVTNVSDHELTNLEIFDAMADPLAPIASRALLKPGEPWTETCQYVVTVSDVKSYPALYNQAAVSYSYDLDGQPYSTPSNIVEVKLFDPDPPTADGLTLTKRCDSEPANHAYYVPGEKIKYTVEIYNGSKSTYAYVAVTDPKAAETYPPYGLIGSYTNVYPGFKDEVSYEYTVTMVDAACYGYVENQATAVVSGPQLQFEIKSNTIIRPAGVPGDEGSLLVEKKEISTPLKDGKYGLGEWIDYEIAVTNTGDLPLHNVTIYDTLKLTDSGVLIVLPHLNPGDPPHIEHFSHQVTQPDVDHKEVYNVAIAEGFDPDGWLVHAESDQVISYTRGEPSTTLAHGRDCCLRTLVIQGAETDEYLLTVCQEHQAVADQAAALLADAAPETAWPQIEALWREALEQLYQELAARSPEAGAVVMNSRNAWLRCLDARAAALREAGKSEADISRILSDAIMVRCIDLCYEAHHEDSAVRADSVITGQYAAGRLGIQPNACLSSLYTGQDGRLRLRELRCDAHSQPDEALFTALRNGATGEELALLFDDAARAHRAMMTVHAAHGDGAMLWQAAAVRLLDADDALWRFLYPDRPEIAAELSWRGARELAVTLCAP